MFLPLLVPWRALGRDVGVILLGRQVYPEKREILFRLVSASLEQPGEPQEVSVAMPSIHRRLVCEPGVLPLECEPPGRSLGGLWEADRAREEPHDRQPLPFLLSG